MRSLPKTLAAYHANILRDAKVLIEQRGWRTGFRQDCNPGGFPIFEYPLCVYDAIVLAGGITAGRPVEIMRGTVAPNGDWRSISIIDWNDARGRTLDQVNEAFDKAIASCGVSP